MRIVGMLIICVCALSGIVVSLPSKEWRGIAPLRSTRADVERLLGSPTEPHGFTYETSNERVTVLYSGGLCGKAGSEVWNVPRDTVTSITVQPKTKLLVSDLQLDRSKYKKVSDPLIADVVYYSNVEEGVNVETRAYEEVVISITYTPAAKDDYLRCPSSSPGQSNTNEGGHVVQSRKFDEYSDGLAKEETRLDEFAMVLHQEPEWKGYVIVYAGRRAYANAAEERADLIKKYLVNKRSVEAERIVTVNGGHREELTVELYVVPRGASAPAAFPTVDPKEVQIIERGNATTSSRRFSRPCRRSGSLVSH